MNLCINAAHAMQDDGTIEIRVDLAPLDAAPAEPGAVPVQAVSLRITDHGTGMSAELQERIFDPFFTTKMPGEGSGLGLSVVYGIVANLGGRIAVSSSTTPGDSGTTFDVRIPVQHHRRT
jgi:two-component system cell cycle sensor histidine kinase/response regulator CckA